MPAPVGNGPRRAGQNSRVSQNPAARAIRQFFSGAPSAPRPQTGHGGYQRPRNGGRAAPAAAPQKPPAAPSAGGGSSRGGGWSPPATSSAPARPAAPSRDGSGSGSGWAAPAAAAVVGTGTPMIRTSGREAVESAKTAMLQNAGMPPLHQIQPIARPNAYSQVGSAAQGQMLSQFNQPPAQSFAEAWQPDRTTSDLWAKGAEVQPVFDRDVTGGIRAIPMDDTLDTRMSSAAQQGMSQAFQDPGALGVDFSGAYARAASGEALPHGFPTSASTLATATAFQGDNPAAAQAGTKAPVQNELDLSRITRPDLRQWAEAHKNAARGLDGKNIVERYLDKLPAAAPAAESPAMPGNTPEASTLISAPTTSGNSFTMASMTDTPAVEANFESDFLTRFRRVNEETTARAFRENGGQFSPGLASVLGSVQPMSYFQ